MKTCESCLSTNIITIPYVNKDVPEDIVHWASYSIDCCKDCGLGVITPEISREDLIRFYRESAEQDPKAYSSKFFTKNLNPGYVSQALMATLHGDFYNKPELHMLDIGCGAFGYSFNAFRAIFKNKPIKFYGIDANPIILKLLEKNDVTYLGEDYSVLAKYHQTFDIITMSHYLEHLIFSDARTCLSEVKGSLRQGGIIMVEVPNDDLRVTERQKIPSAPHTTFFSLSAIKKIVEQAGFEILYANAVGPGAQILWDGYYRKVALGNFLQQTLRSIKKTIPIYIKERIKNLIHKISTEQLLSEMAIVNSQGSFLRVIARNKSWKQT